MAYERFEPRAEWTARYFAWSDSTDPRSRADAFTALLRGTPALERRERRLDYLWHRPTVPELPQAKWALDATATLELPPGEYTLRAISDDGVRVEVDGELVIDRWTLHESTVDVAPLAGGRHQLRVQFFQVEGWTELRVEIVKGRQLSRGSPGPH
jgi:hypothetical protein